MFVEFGGNWLKICFSASRGNSAGKISWIKLQALWTETLHYKLRGSIGKIKFFF